MTFSAEHFPINTSPEQGLVFTVQRFSLHDGPGIRTTVFMKGCPLNCTWCHNPESLLELAQPMKVTRHLEGRKREVIEVIGRMMRTKEVMEEVEKDRIFYEESGGGVTFSGGEPLMQPAFLESLLHACRQAGIHTAIDTSGHADTDTFLQMAGQTDLLLYDLKSADSKAHEVFTGADNGQIIQNLMALPPDGPELVIRIPLIPGFNNDREQMQALLALVKKARARVTRIELLPYHRLGRHKYKALGMDPPAVFKPEPSPEEITQWGQLFSSAGYPVNAC